MRHIPVLKNADGKLGKMYPVDAINDERERWRKRAARHLGTKSVKVLLFLLAKYLEKILLGIMT